MKRLLFSLFILLMILSIADDLKTDQRETIESIKIHALQEHRVQPGETVLSIVEESSSNGLSTVSVSNILDDFSKYNNNMDPYHIVPGKVYLFPVYTN